ncbi:NAD(P)-dependent oxidoreductase [Neobacillus citreus]|uniref:NAD(P)-binding domain-containing protein n=1 Tax=Neobacillus citreus TaxID=2833578 RepID=A0A942T324_9BACI|nr:NAD(P)-dependent oxidoreductase [Neobacillus citreus]MCH6266000.1 NAD(P)-binding domain-containing protein [Neobacillus citreus]
MNLLLTGAYSYSQTQIKLLESLGLKIVYIQDERIPLGFDVSDIDAVVCNGLFLYNEISKFKSLKFIQLTSAGIERVPIDYIKENNIIICNAKEVYSNSIAEFVILKVLEIFKKSRYFYKLQEECRWEKQRDLLELTDKYVSIIGYGDIGKAVAYRLKPFGVKLIGVGRRPIQSDLIDEYYLIDQLEEVLWKSDIIILTVPLTKQTFHLINEHMLNQMKNNSVLVNISRGSIIDERALFHFVNNGKFLGVVLDVFEEEPLPRTNPLWGMERIIITPHNSYVSDKTNARLFSIIVNNLKNFIQNRQLKEL